MSTLRFLGREANSCSHVPLLIVGDVPAKVTGEIPAFVVWSLGTGIKRPVRYKVFIPGPVDARPALMDGEDVHSVAQFNQN